MRALSLWDQLAHCMHTLRRSHNAPLLLAFACVVTTCISCFMTPASFVSCVVQTKNFGILGAAIKLDSQEQLWLT